MLGAVLIFVILVGELHHAVSFLGSVDFSDLARACLSRLLFVGNEVVLQALDEGVRAIVDVAPGSKGGIVFHHPDEFVVRFVVVDHAQAADDARGEQNIAMGDGTLRDDADVDRVVVAHDPCSPRHFHAAMGDSLVAQGLGYQPVGEGAGVGVGLWSVDHQQAGVLVELVLDSIRGDHLDEAAHTKGVIVADVDAVPWVSLEEMALVQSGDNAANRASACGRGAVCCCHGRHEIVIGRRAWQVATLSGKDLAR